MLTSSLEKLAEKQVRIKFKVLKKNKVKLTPEEHALVMKRGATWNHYRGTVRNRKSNRSAAIWKSIVNGETYYGSNTHRAMRVARTLKKAISDFEWVKTTA